MAIGVVRRAQDHALVSRLGVRFVQPPRSRRAIYTYVGVVHAAPARAEFQAANEPRAGARHGDDEVAEDVSAVGSQRLFGKHDDEVRRPELPA
jgi:hypothetical protein